MASCLDTYKEKFARKEMSLTSKGNIVVNPACLPRGLDSNAYMPICMAMLDACDTIYMMAGWENSKGAMLELDYAKYHNKKVIYEAVI